MTFQTIDTAEPNFPTNLFTTETDTVEVSDSDCIAIPCCTYNYYPVAIDSIWMSNADN